MSAFDQITFLADSPSRIAVLEALQAGPRERNDLQEAVSVSRSTIHRILEGPFRWGEIDQCDPPVIERVEGNGPV